MLKTSKTSKSAANLQRLVDIQSWAKGWLLFGYFSKIFPNLANLTDQSFVGFWNLKNVIQTIYFRGERGIKIESENVYNWTIQQFETLLYRQKSRTKEFDDLYNLTDNNNNRVHRWCRRLIWLKIRLRRNNRNHRTNLLQKWLENVNRKTLHHTVSRL